MTASSASPGTSWDAIEALPQTVAVDHPERDFPPAGRACPSLADPFASDDPLPGAYELHLPTDEVTIWYTVSEHQGQVVIIVQHASLETSAGLTIRAPGSPFISNRELASLVSISFAPAQVA